jgi:O-methyltransferase
MDGDEFLLTSSEQQSAIAIRAYQEGRLSEAEQIYRQILQISPEDLSSLNGLGLIVRHDEAIELFRKALTVSPDSVEAYVNLGNTYAASGHWGAASAYYEHALRIKPDLALSLGERLAATRKNAVVSADNNYIKAFPWVSETNNKEKSARFADALGKLITAFPSMGGGGIFASDSLIAYGRNLSFMGDSALMNAIKKSDDPVAAGIVWRTTVLVWAARHGLRLNGDFVECGAYKGTTARIIYDALGLDKIDKYYWLYDTFLLPEIDKNKHLDAAAEGLYPGVVQLFMDAPRVRIIKGYVPESFKQGTPSEISFMHIDMNNASPEIAALEELWERVVPGAFVVLDDYGWQNYADQKAQEDIFFEKRGYHVLELPTGQGLVLK